MREFAREFVLACRQLSQARGAVASLTLAIGLSAGANLAVFTQLYEVMAPASPFADPESLVVIEHTGRYSKDDDSTDPDSRRLSYPDFRDLEQQQRRFSALGAVDSSRMALMWGADRPRAVSRMFVWPHTLEVLGLVPTVGRGFSRANFESGAGGVALLTEGVWRRYFAADPSIVGRSIHLDEQPFSVIGVVSNDVAEMLQPRTRLFTANTNDLWVITPFVAGSAGEEEGVLRYLRSEQGRNRPSLLALGRLAAGVSQVDASTELSVIGGRLRQQAPTRPGDFSLRAVPFPAWRTGPIRPLLLMLTLAAALTLLVACANAAGLLMAESVRRAPEFATRLALGATPGHLVRVVAARSFAWCLPGSVAGLLFANGIVAVLAWAGPGGGEPIHAGKWLLLVNGALTVVVALSSGAAALWALRGQDLSQSLREGAQTISGQPRGRATMALLAVQVAAGVALAFGAGLLLRSIWILSTSDYGFDREHGFVVEVRLPRSGYRSTNEQSEFYSQALSRVRSLPGVTAAGMSSSPPLTQATTILSGSLRLTTPTETREIDRLHAQFVSSGYFEALGLKLLRGRLFSAEDERTGAAAIVVDESFCGRFLGTGDPLTAVLWFGGKSLRIVGVVGDTRQSVDGNGLSGVRTDTGTVYLSLAQNARPPTWRFLVIRTSLRSAEVARGAVDAITSLDPLAFIGNPKSFNELIATRTEAQRRLSLLLGTMAAIVVLLMAASLTGALSQLVTLRSRELAVRYCLGAGAHHIFALTLKHVGATLAAGLLLGVGAGLLLSTTLASQLYGNRPTDGWTFVCVLAILTTLAILAAVGPVRRASCIDLAVTLRNS
jgi:predicted permease